MYHGRAMMMRQMVVAHATLIGAALFGEVTQEGLLEFIETGRLDAETGPANEPGVEYSSYDQAAMKEVVRKLNLGQIRN